VLPTNRLGIVYYEAEIIQKKENGIEMGLSNGDDFKVAWASAGNIIRNDKHVKILEEFKAGDTIGIGWMSELRTIFFIKNGRYKGCLSADSAALVDELSPYLKSEMGTVRLQLASSFTYDLIALPLLYRDCKVCTETHSLSSFPKLTCGCSSTCSKVRIISCSNLKVCKKNFTDKIVYESRVSMPWLQKRIGNFGCARNP
jgi:hypothetical protein